jgi:hypothetical protein
MDITKLGEMHDELVAQLARGNESGAMDYLRSRFKDLPEEMQGEILAELYIDAMNEESARIETIGKIQEQGIAALKVLEMLKTELKKEARKTKA